MQNSGLFWEWGGNDHRKKGLNFHSYVLLSLFLISKSPEGVKKASMAAVLWQEIKCKMKPAYISKTVLF